MKSKIFRIKWGGPENKIESLYLALVSGTVMMARGGEGCWNCKLK